LPSSWDTIVSVVSSARGSNELKNDEIHDAILSESIRKKDSRESSGSALNVRGRGKQRGQSKNRGHSNLREGVGFKTRNKQFGGTVVIRGTLREIVINLRIKEEAITTMTTVTLWIPLKMWVMLIFLV